MWMKRRYRGVGDDAEHLAYPGERSAASIAIHGVLIPLAIAVVAVRAWVTESAVLSGEGGDVDLSGKAGRAMAVAYFAVAVFLHARALWGALGFERTHKVLAVLSCLVFSGAVFTAIVWGFGGL